MKGKKVEFNNDGTMLEGVIMDKVRLMPSGGRSNYDNYVILHHSGKVYCVNPINVKTIITQKQTSKPQ